MNRIKELRTQRKITQEELGKIINVQKAAVSKYELGRAVPSTDVLTKLANYFNVTTDYLLGRTNEPQGTGFQKGLLGDTTQDSHIVMTSNTLGDSDTDDIQRRYSQLDEAGKAAVKNLMSIFENAKKTN